MRIERCDRCRFFFSALGERQCRQSSPVVFPVQSPVGGLGWAGTWPPVREEQWCGKFEIVVAAVRGAP